jgi:hypothetical protein
VQAGRHNRHSSGKRETVTVRQLSHTTDLRPRPGLGEGVLHREAWVDARFDVSMGEEFEGAGQGFRWLTVSPKEQPNLQIVLSSCEMGRSAEQRRALVAAGAIGAGALTTDDCRENLPGAQREGVTFLSEPTERALRHRRR